MAKRFGEVVVKTNREPVIENGKPKLDSRNRPLTVGVGSRIETGGKVYVLPQWPSRVSNVEVKPNGTLAVEFNGGERTRMLDASDALTESAAGGSMGGHDPKAHGKIRYIVRAFGKWAKGQHSVCVRRISTEHPEVATGKNLNALCAWLKDQWAGTTKWRGRKSDPKQRAEGKAIMRRASATAYARFAESMPVALTEADLDVLVADVQQLTGMSPSAVLREDFGVHWDPERVDSVFEELWRREVAASADAILEAHQTIAGVFAGNTDPALLEGALSAWLGAHGDGGRIGDDPASVRDAAMRVLQEHGGSAQTMLEQRVARANQLVEASWTIDDEDYDPVREGLAMATRDAVAHPGDRQEVMRLLREFDLVDPDTTAMLEQASLNQIANVLHVMREAMKKCPNCGRKIAPNAAKCRHCGKRCGSGYGRMRESSALEEPTPPPETISTPDLMRRLLAPTPGAWEQALAIAEQSGWVPREQPVSGGAVHLSRDSAPMLVVKFAPADQELRPVEVIAESATRKIRLRAGKSRFEEARRPAGRGRQPRQPRGAPDRNRDGRGDGGQFAGKSGPPVASRFHDDVPLGVGSGTRLTHSRSGRGPSGAVRNFRSMDDRKLAGVIDEMLREQPQDIEAMRAAWEAATLRGWESSPTSRMRRFRTAVTESALTEAARGWSPAGGVGGRLAALVQIRQRARLKVREQERKARAVRSAQEARERAAERAKAAAEKAVAVAKVAASAAAPSSGGDATTATEGMLEAATGWRTQPAVSSYPGRPHTRQQAQRRVDTIGRRSQRSNRRQGSVLGGWHGRDIRDPTKRKRRPRAGSQRYLRRSVKGWSAGGVSLGTGYRKPKGSNRVKSVQSFLRKRGYSVGSVDGRFGSRTAGAVRAFQEKHGLKVDGIVGPATVRHMRFQQRKAARSR